MPSTWPAGTRRVQPHHNLPMPALVRQVLHTASHQAGLSISDSELGSIILYGHCVRDRFAQCFMNMQVGSYVFGAIQQTLYSTSLGIPRQSRTMALDGNFKLSMEHVLQPAVISISPEGKSKLSANLYTGNYLAGHSGLGRR